MIPMRGFFNLRMKNMPLLSKSPSNVSLGIAPWPLSCVSLLAVTSRCYLILWLFSLLVTPLKKLCEDKDDSSLINLLFPQCLPQCLAH